MKYVLALIVLFSTPAYAHMYHQSNGTGFAHNNGTTLVNQKQKQRVTMFTTNTCPYCRQARNYFRANRIPYRERNIDRSIADLRAFEAMNAYGTPVILLGRKKLFGFSVARFRQFYR